MATSSQADVAAQLIERLLVDQDFRARFRRDPAAACRDAGLDELAQEMSLGAGKAMMTLDVRESKSSLAGVMMAAAMEGVGLYEFSQNVLPHLEDVPGAVGDVLSRVNLPAVGGALASPPPASGATPAPPAEAPAAAAPAAAPPEAAPPVEEMEAGGGEKGAAAAAGGNGAGGGKGAGADAAAVPPEQAAADAIKAAASPEAKQAEAAAEAVAKIADEAEDLPDANDFPDGGVKAQAAEEVGPGGKPAPEPAEIPAAPPEAAAPAAPAPVPAAAPEPASGGRIDPGDFGAEGTGTGGEPSAEALALLENENVVLDEVGVADVKAGRIDPRIIAVLTKLSGEHEITVSCMCSDHSKFTSGGSISNHHYGRGLDIAAIDGVPVNASNFDAREIAMELQELDSAIRPNEIGTPWAISGPGYFTDAGHQDHLHVGFKEQITADWTPPTDLTAAPAAAPAAAAAAAPGAAPAAAAAPVVPERKVGDSMTFAAVSKQAAAAAASGAGAKPGDSLAFIAAVEPQQPAPAAAAPEAAAAASAPVSGPAEYPGDDAPREQLAAWLASEAQKRGLPPELPVMAAIVESDLKNLNYGDADSVGFFQMRVGIWNQGAYAGYPDDPQKQIDWFLDTAEQVKKTRQANGQSIDDPNQYGDWIADIERPAEQYRGRYQTKLTEAQTLLKDTPTPPADTPAPAAPAPVPAAAPEPASGGRIDPGDFGAEGTGTGGEPSAEALALLENENVVLDEVGVADVKAGRIDPRIIAVLTKLSGEHEITVSCMCSDHSKFTSGGSISNHHYGRGLDIAAIDGVPVNASNFDAREIAMELQELDSAIRPNEIGTPWAISGPGYFTDAGHQDHLHVGFKEQITADWTPPADLTAAPGAAPAAAPAAAAAAAPGAAPAAAAAPVVPERKVGDSMTFAAVSKQAAAAAASGAGAKPGDSLAFIAAVEPQQPAPAAAAPEAAAAASAPVSGPAEYPGDDAPREQLAAWLASEAQKRGLPPELPVMAAIVESDLKNLNYGDADSVGFFQMRVGIWNQGAYAGYPDDPQKQIDWFLDTAEQVKKTRQANGQSIDDPNQYGDWIADIERPAEQYRGRYQTKLTEAQTLLKNAPAAAPPGDGAAPTAAEAAGGASPAAGSKAMAALAEAKKYMGTPYQWGGSTPETGFDCSGLVQWAYAQAGIQIPRVTDQQILADSGTEVARDALKPGDLVFFRNESGYVYHVGMSLGGDEFMHAPRTGDVVKVASLDEPYFAQNYTGARRFDQSGPAPAAPAPAAPAAAPAAADPTAVAQAQAAVARDAAEVRRNDSLLFTAVKAQEAANHHATVQFMKAIDPQQAKAAAAAAAPAPAVPPEAAAAAPAPAPAPEPAPAADTGPPPDLTGVDADYPGDDASQADLAKWLAKQAVRNGLPPELPVMAALVESDVKNLNFGHADSVGFFQMRVGIWNQGAYEGYPEKPELQAKWFIDTALAVKKQKIAGGDVDFGKDASAWGEWIADIERPAEEYRGRYQLRLGEARKLLA